MAAPIRTLTLSYGSPIVAGITPYTLARNILPSVGSAQSKEWPPSLDGERLDLYRDFEALIENRPHDVSTFENLRLSEGQETKIAIALALPELLCNVWADAVWGEGDAITIEFKDDAMATKWEAVAKANDLPTLGWESVFGAAFSGTSVFRIGRDERNLDSIGTEIRIEEISPSIYFPALRAGSAREVEAVALAWEEDRGDDKVEVWQIKELHEVVRGQYVITKYERKGTEGGSFHRVGEPKAPTGMNFLPFVDLHAKRWRGRFWGVSELSRNMSLFDEIDNTLSNIAEVLEYHGKPVLQVPASVLVGDKLFKGVDRAIGIRNPQEAEVARYITFDGLISDQLASLSKNLELALLVSEVPWTYFGVTEGGADTGVAMRLRLQNYLKKAGRWNRAQDHALDRLTDMVGRIDDSAAGGKLTRAERTIAEITHGSPLPADDEQEARIEQGLVEARLSSRKTSITRLRRVKDVDEEIAEIDADTELAAQSSMGGSFGDPRDPLPGGKPEPEQPVAGQNRRR